MIRIDEIYNNVFLAALQDQTATGLHWFDPFGSTKFNDLVNSPPIDYFDAKHRIIFWDQEPIHRDIIQNFLNQFIGLFRHAHTNRQYPITLVTSEYNSDDVQWACDTYSLKSAYYFFHGWAALDWYRGYNHTYLMTPFKDRRLTYTFLCPNNIIGGKRKHRLELFSELVNRDLVHNNLVSFPSCCPYENKTVTELCQEYDIHLSPVDLPLKIDNGIDYHNNSHCIDMWKLADQSLLHVVTETVYNGQKQHITEKTFKPIVMQQPFILVSCQGSLEYMRMYGFKTFRDFWDESYDDSDDNSRILKIGKLLNDLNHLSPGEKKQLQHYLTPIVEHNYNWFYSREYEQLLWKELQGMIDADLLCR